MLRINLNVVALSAAITAAAWAQQVPSTRPAAAVQVATRPGVASTSRAAVKPFVNPLEPPKMPPAVNPARGARWSCPGTVYDFGKVWQNSNVVYQFEIKNTSDTDLEIIDAKAECHCTVPGQFERIIKPGKSGFVPFTLHTAGLGKYLVKRCNITLNDPQMPVLTVQLNGFVQTLFNMNPNDVGNFAEITDPNAKISREAEIVSNIDEPFTFELVPNSNAKKNFTVDLKEIEKGKRWKLKITTNPPLPAGSLMQFFTFRTSDPHLPGWNLMITGFRPERIAAKPMNLLMPPVVTSASPFTVEVMNYGKAAFKVLSAEVRDTPELKTEIVPNGPHYKVNVLAPMGYKLPEARHLIIKTDDPTLPSIDVTLYKIVDRPNLPPIQRKPASQPGVAGGQRIGPRPGGKKRANAAASQPASLTGEDRPRAQP